ncbi:Peptidase C19 ubiquitin carboxyl-terminal hydrolase 2 [Penicillium macrosclerotiorum]|uniref:Peptidase C19 ubiquitin carboxyl-terminal hydrolase 2 n=1 Tax=Penicillium macrosclerotiorum TaxID=303699 RepID=UPI002548DD2E|nr:Peptidase C19 ubiquitin carboxyl-terminal hydrolase 2 [Penicillium macrosclerotiorum]KAJ5693307.1 Peptidase C19 ubiquitin carboxyl-terminal hydrolase 2 [Penicillium macrosclerotiorum]
MIDSGNCSTCNNPRSTRVELGHPPEVLLVHLNRITYHKSAVTDAFETTKINRPITFSAQITLPPSFFDSRWGTDRQAVEYELSSVQIHQGPNTDRGHYQIALQGKDRTWVLANDEKLSGITSFEEFSADKEFQKVAYVFAYRRLPTNPAFQSLLEAELCSAPGQEPGTWTVKSRSAASTAIPVVTTAPSMTVSTAPVKGAPIVASIPSWTSTIGGEGAQTSGSFTLPVSDDLEDKQRCAFRIEYINHKGEQKLSKRRAGEEPDDNIQKKKAKIAKIAISNLTRRAKGKRKNEKNRG